MSGISKIIKILFLMEKNYIDTQDPMHSLTDFECLQGLLTERDQLDKNMNFPNRIGYRTYEEVLTRLAILDRMIAELVGEDEDKMIVEMTGTES